MKEVHAKSGCWECQGRGIQSPLIAPDDASLEDYCFCIHVQLRTRSAFIDLADGLIDMVPAEDAVWPMREAA